MTTYVNDKNFGVEFLTQNRGSDDSAGRATKMPALGAASAQPLRNLDFPIVKPVQAVLLHKGGIPVTVPAPERYAVHKLIVAVQRKNDANGMAKARKASPGAWSPTSRRATSARSTPRFTRVAMTG